jgi:hypothetical protein
MRKTLPPEVAELLTSEIKARESAEIEETVETGETLEIASIDAVVVHVAGNMVGWQNGRGEYPTLSATYIDSLQGIA